MNELKNIKVDAAKKQRDFERVVARLEKPVLPWQVPLVVLGVVMLSFFFLITWSEPQSTTAEHEPELQAVYRLYGEGNPYSIWQMWVTRSSHQAVLQAYETLLQEAKPVQQLADEASLGSTYRFVYSDGTFVRYERYYTAGASYLYDLTNNRYYEIANEDDYYEIQRMDEYDAKGDYFKFYLIALVLYFIVDVIVGRNLRDAHEKKKRLPIHSTAWQPIVTASAFSIVAICAFIVPNLHYSVAVVIMLFATLCHILLEQACGKNHWRMLNFILMGCWNLIMLTTLFLWL